MTQFFLRMAYLRCTQAASIPRRTVSKTTAAADKTSSSSGNNWRFTQDLSGRDFGLESNHSVASVAGIMPRHFRQTHNKLNLDIYTTRTMKHLPHGLRLMHTSSASTDSLLDEPSEELQQRRMSTIRRLERLVQQRWGTSYTIGLFGSVSYGVSNSDSDLDLAILDANFPMGTPRKARLPDIYQFRKLGRVFSKTGYRSVRTVENARVPIVKILDAETGIKCDVNMNNRVGIYNSKLLNHYCDIFPPLRPMIRLIKSWAKKNGLNSPGLSDPGEVTFSSYALTLMTIALLQRRALVPNLQEGLPDRTNGFVWAGSHLCDVRFHERYDWQPANVDLEDILLEWLRYWGSEFCHKSHEVAIRDGGILASSLPNVKYIVRDPFEPRNVAQHVKPQAFNRFAQLCRDAANAVENGTQGLFTVMAARSGPS